MEKKGLLGDTSGEIGVGRDECLALSKLTLDACRQATKGVRQPMQVDRERLPLNDPTMSKKDEQQ